jgi:hypothetical protein
MIDLLLFIWSAPARKGLRYQPRDEVGLSTSWNIQPVRRCPVVLRESAETADCSLKITRDAGADGRTALAATIPVASFRVTFTWAGFRGFTELDPS